MFLESAMAEYLLVTAARRGESSFKHKQFLNTFKYNQNLHKIIYVINSLRQFNYKSGTDNYYQAILRKTNIFFNFSDRRFFLSGYCTLNLKF